MAHKAVTILGGGNTAFSAAANLTLLGYRVTLYEIPEFEVSLEPVRNTSTIHLEGVAEHGTAVIHRMTTDIEEALRASDLVLLMVPANAHRPFAEVCASPLRSGQVVVVMPGTLGTLEWARILREAGTSGIILAETDTSPYVCRKTASDTATIWGVVKHLGLGVLPATETDRIRQLLEPLFPGLISYRDVMACGLSALNPVVHPAGVLMNAGRIEYSRGDFYFYREGVTPSVAKVVMKVDAERRAIAKALGYDLCPAEEAFSRAGFGPKGDLWATINGSYMLTQLKAPGTLESRWLTEDIPYGLAVWSSIGAQYGVETPMMRSVVNIASVVMGFDGWTSGRGLKELGIAGMQKQELAAYLKVGYMR